MKTLTVFMIALVTVAIAFIVIIRIINKYGQNE